MELEQAVIQYQLKKGMKETDKWMYLLIEKVRIPVFPMLSSIKDQVFIHDAHHLIIGFNTSLKGKGQVLAWTMASGGLGQESETLSFLIMFSPLEVWRAFKLGLKQHNLFKLDIKQVKKMNYETVEHYVKSRR